VYLQAGQPFKRVYLQAGQPFGLMLTYHPLVRSIIDIDKDTFCVFDLNDMHKGHLVQECLNTEVPERHFYN